MMSSTSEQDPFLQVQADVLTQLTTTRSLFASFLRIRSLSASTVPSPELLSARSDLEASLSTLSEDLSDLRAAVRAVKTDPHKFGLEIEEVTRRKRLVEEVGGEVEDMREELAKPFPPTFSASRSTSKQQQQQRRGSKSAMSRVVVDGEDPLSPSPSKAGAGNGNSDSYTAFEHQEQIRMMHEQEEQLDGVFHTVGNLRQQASTMGRELEEQAEMLEVVDGLADRLGGRLQTGIQKMGHVMKKNEDRISSCCIGLLILILVILLILVLII